LLQVAYLQSIHDLRLTAAEFMATWDEQLAEELNALDEEMNYELQRRNWSRNISLVYRDLRSEKSSKNAKWKAMKLVLGELRINIWKND